VLNVRLDEPLAREIGRIARGENRSDSEVARTLLSYGIEVVRRLEADAFVQPFAWTQRPDHEPHPEVIEIKARRRPMTEEEIDGHGLRPYVGDTVEAEDDQ
jgi:hypothetical protein